MLVIAWPEAMRRPHASVVFLKLANSFGMTRVPLVPIAWQDMQPLVLAEFSHSAWLFMPSAMPLPLPPVPGNSDFAGTLSIAYQ